MNTNKKGKRKNPPQNNSKKRKPTANNAEKETERKENKMCNILERKGTNLSLLATIVGLFSTLCAFTNFVYDINYKIKCGNFYGIPEKYFSTSVNKNILYRLIVIASLIYCLIPPILEKYSRKQKDGIKFDTLYLIFLSVLIGIMMSAAVAHNLGVISTYDDNIILSKVESVLSNWNIETVAVVLTALCIVVAIGITFLSKLSHWEKILREIYSIVIVSIFVLNMAIIIHGTWITFTLDLNIKNKTKYEFVKYECDEYVVLSEYNDKVLLVPFQVDEDGKYIFNTGEYIFKELDSGIFEYRNLGCTPDIEK